MSHIIDAVLFLFLQGLEAKFMAFQGYESRSILPWKRQTGLSLLLVHKILRRFNILNGSEIRQLIRNVVLDNETTFSQPNCYITGFGNEGKSGDVIFYDFSHTQGIPRPTRIKTWQIASLPSDSTIIFVEDIIGTGTQSVDYILDTLNPLLLPSHRPILFSLCATPQGLQRVSDETRFDVLFGLLLNEEHQYYSDENSFFTAKEKHKIIEVNKQLKGGGRDFDMGLLLAFYFGVPNNTMPIFWKNGYRYMDKHGKQKVWKALVPRQF